LLSKYFKFKVKTDDFKNNTKNIVRNLKGKKILICGDIESFLELNKNYNFDKELDIVAFANFGKNKKIKLRTILPEQIASEVYDYILITGEDSNKIYNSLYYDFHLENAKIERLFFEEIKDGKQNLEFLLNNNFGKRIKCLKQKLKNKTVLLYGAGVLFELIHKYFDLSGLNIIGITDKKFKDTYNIQEFYGYKVYKPQEIKRINPDVVLISLKRFIPIWEDLYFGVCRKTNIDIKSMVKMNIVKLLCEIADN